MLTALCKRGEADLVLPKVEGSVGVLHKAVAKEPDVAAQAEVLARERTNALTRPGVRLSEVEAEKRSQRHEIGRTRKGHTFQH